MASVCRCGLILWDMILPQDGNTALMSAVTSNDIEMAQLLLDKGANIEAADKVSQSWQPMSVSLLLGRGEWFHRYLFGCYDIVC